MTPRASGHAAGTDDRRVVPPAAGRTARGGERLVVDPIACDGHGLCAALLPELIGLDDWGYPLVADDAIPPELATHARRAVAACPTLALRRRRVAALTASR